MAPINCHKASAQKGEGRARRLAGNEERNGAAALNNGAAVSDTFPRGPLRKWHDAEECEGRCLQGRVEGSQQAGCRGCIKVYNNRYIQFTRKRLEIDGNRDNGRGRCVPWALHVPLSR